MDGSDGSLDLVRAGLPCRRPRYQLDAFADIPGVPEGSILLGHRDQLAMQTGARARRASVSSMSARSPATSVSFGSNCSHVRASRIASDDRSVRYRFVPEVLA